MRSKIAVLVILSLTGILLAGNIFSEFSATPYTDRVVISWRTQAEDQVNQFVILRSNDDNTFIEIAKVNPNGPGSVYEYTDENVMFKNTSVLFYKVRAVDRNGKPVYETTSTIVHPNMTGIFRTWGAIKAMFK